MLRVSTSMSRRCSVNRRHASCTGGARGLPGSLGVALGILRDIKKAAANATIATALIGELEHLGVAVRNRYKPLYNVTSTQKQFILTDDRMSRL